jgi:thymidine phosphorylase
MHDIINAQGRQEKHFQPAPLVYEVTARKAGTVTSIDNYRMARIARLAGAPMDKGSGVDLLKKLGDPVAQGEPLYRVHARFPADFRFAKAFIESGNGYRVGATDEVPEVFAEF